MDSYKLVSRGATLRAIAFGALAAAASMVLNRSALDALQLEPQMVRRYLAPCIEEILKASYIVYLIRAGRVGFTVDAGILGFAVGTGFSLIENIYYAASLGDFDPILWIVRGLGTAVMHG